MIFKDKELEKLVSYKLGKFNNEEITDSELQNIKEISVNNTKFSGEQKNVDLEELRKLSNLRSILLQNFAIDDSVVNILNSLKTLETIQLASCTINSTERIKINSLESMYLNCCKIEDYSKIVSPRVLTITGEDGLRLDRINGKENVEKLALQDCKVKKFKAIEEFSNLKELTLEGTKIDDEKSLEQLVSKVKIIKEEEYRPMR